MRATSVWGVLVASGMGTALLAGGVHAEGEAAPAGAASASVSVSSASSEAPKPAASTSATEGKPPPKDDAPNPPAKGDKPAEKAEPAIKGPWYGWQSLLASLAVSGGALVAYRRLDTERRIPILVSGITLQIALAPAIHLAHGNHAAVGRSIALQTALVAGGALLGAYAVQGLAGCPGPQSPCDRLDGTDFAALGALVGAIVAPAVDAGWLGFEAAPATPAGAAIAPTFGLLRGGVAQGLGGGVGPGPGGISGGVLGLAGVF